MTELLQTMTQYHWLTLAFVLLIFEVLGFSGFMLGFFLAGIIVSITMMIIDITWQAQWIIFAVISLASSIAWYVFQFNKDTTDEETTKLNRKDNQLVGKVFTLDEDIKAGNSRIKLADSTWPIYSEKAMKKGEVIKVTKLDGITLHIEKSE